MPAVLLSRGESIDGGKIGEYGLLGVAFHPDFATNGYFFVFNTAYSIPNDNPWIGATSEMAPRYGIETDKAFGTAMSDVQEIARRLGRDHALAAALWGTGWYEARTLAALIDEPHQVSAAQMDRWCRDFDNWAICDNVCFQLFDRTPHALGKVWKWARSREEFVRRAAFALLASVALHDKSAASEMFADCLPLIEAAATDERNFVKKAVSWALRAIGERNAELHGASLAAAARLADSASASACWAGKGALKQLNRPAVLHRLAKRG